MDKCCIFPADIHPDNWKASPDRSDSYSPPTVDFIKSPFDLQTIARYTLPIDTSAVRIYYKMIKYESGLNLQEREGQVWCGDSLVERYTFRTNWYFMGGDNMWNSQDSRYLGPIPEEFIIGKATLILTAKDPETKAYRWRRFFTRIRKEVKNR